MNTRQLTIWMLMFLFFYSIQTNAQIKFDGNIYYPNPIPEVDSVISSSEIFYDNFIRYSLENHEATELPLDFSNSDNTSNGFLIEGNNIDETNGLPESFSNLSYFSNTESHPQRTIVKLFIENNGSYTVCSGVLIGKDQVLTAGHCAYDTQNGGGWADKITVVPGYDNGASPFGIAYATYLNSWEGWTQNEDYAWDVAILELDWCIGNNTGWLGYGYNDNDSYFQNKFFHNFSYPAAFPYDGEYLYYQNGYFDIIDQNILYHTPDGYGGMSGSGYYYKDNSSNRYVYGILSHVTSAGYTGAIRLNQTMYNTIQNLGATICSVNTTDAQVEEVEVNLYPNPTAEILNIKLEGLENDKINSVRIINSKGQIFYQGPFVPSIDVSHFYAGIYNLIIGLEQQVITKKFVVIK